jgi:carboxypeptidase C (cathepsin A)
MTTMDAPHFRGICWGILAAMFATLRLRHLALLIALLVPAATLAQEPKTAPAERQQNAGVLRLLPEDVVTDHSIKLRDGRKLDYAATAGTLDLFGQDGQRTAAIFYTAYARKGGNAAQRPITFVFNGGPGAASAYLHLGVAGPRIASFGPNGHDGASAKVVDNPDTWLDFTDLVFIDPVGTGWSRAVKPDDAKNFYNVRTDALTLAKVIALYSAKNARTSSPKYLLGESYGGFRAVKVARSLQHDQGIVPAGIIALSPLLEGSLQFGATRFALGAALQLPSLAAAELERRGQFTPDALDAAEHFAMTDYLTALAGPPPQGQAADAFYRRVADLTGLPLDVVARTRGFVRDAYVKHLRDKDVVSPYDVGFAVPDPYPESGSAHNDDPVLDGFTRALGGLTSGYIRNELGFKTEMTYELLASDISRKWDWQGESMGRASATSDIRELLALNPSFRLMVAHGTSDLVTPYAVSRYVVNHLPPIGGADRVQLKLYRGGHMFYFTPASRLAFTNDAKAFYAPAAE